jgi:hypothetical protein
MLQNPEAERYFEPLSAHSDVAEEFFEALRRLGEYERRGGSREYAAPYIVTKDVVFCAAAGICPKRIGGYGQQTLKLPSQRGRSQPMWAQGG